jgi:hypothetical protein
VSLNEFTLDPADYDKLLDFVFNSQKGGSSRFPGMSYEDGILAVLDVIVGNLTVEDVTGD